MFLINILARSLVVLLGLLVTFGIPPFDSAPSPFHEIFGIVVVLFGVYRLVTFSLIKQRTER